MAVSVLQTLLGFALYPYFLPGVFALVFAIFGDAVQVRIWHTTLMWVFLSFTAVHVYLVCTEDARLVKAMVDGYYYRKTPGGRRKDNPGLPLRLRRLGEGAPFVARRAVNLHG